MGRISRKEFNRRRIVAAAVAVFEESGYDAVSFGDIAAELGMGRTTIYEHFTDMQDLLAAVVEERLPLVSEDILAGIPEGPGSRERLAELAVRMLEFAVTDHALGLDLHTELPLLRPEIQERIAAAHASLAGEFGRIYRQGVEDGEFRAIPDDLAARFIQDLIMAGAKTLIRDDDPKQRLHEVADETAQFLLAGLSPL